MVGRLVAWLTVDNIFKVLGDGCILANCLLSKARSGLGPKLVISIRDELGLVLFYLIHSSLLLIQRGWRIVKRHFFTIVRSRLGACKVHCRTRSDRILKEVLPEYRIQHNFHARGIRALVARH